MSIVARLDRWLSENRPEYHAQLLPGASDESLIALEKSTGELPAVFKELYRWRNGQSEDSFDALQFNWCWMSLDAILRARETLNELLEDGEFEQDHWWSATWLPFLSNGGGDHLCIDVGEEFPGSRGCVLNFYHDWEDRSAEYPDFISWLTVFVESLESGLWKDDDGDLEPRSDDEWEDFKKARHPDYPKSFQAG